MLTGMVPTQTVALREMRFHSGYAGTQKRVPTDVQTGKPPQSLGFA